MSQKDTSGIWKAGGFSIRAFMNSLPSGYSAEEVRNEAFSGRLRDTFDGHLRRAGKVLVQDGSKAVLLDLKSGRIDEQETAADWKFAEELKGGAVGFQCMELSRLRAFSSIADLEVQVGRWAVKDELEKTVVRFGLIRLVYGSRHAVWIGLRPLRGYDAAARRIRAVLETCGFCTGRFDYFSMFGIRVPLYESKPGVEVLPESPVVENAGRIAERFIAAARKNERGIIDDVDTEFLHDYRVSLRRVRSLLSLFKGVYAEDFCASVKAQLADTMKQTNRLRDLDVYLLDRGAYYDMVPESLSAGLDIMFRVFREERDEQLRQVQALFEAAAYDCAMKKLAAAFQPLDKKNCGPAAQENTLHFAKRLILKRYRKIESVASGFNASTPEREVHKLRIQCKKLRYLMEFFLPLFPPKRVKPLVKPLKGLQEVLGRFNDYCVQRESLASFASSHPMRGRKGLLAAESAGALVATLFQLQKKARREVESNLEQFVNRDTAAAFRALFAEG